MQTTKNIHSAGTGTPDPAALDSVVREAVAHLDAVYQILSDFVRAPAEGFKEMRTASTVPDVFLEASAVAAENDETMQAATGLDPARTRMVINRNLRFEPLAAAAEALARDIRYNMLRERWDVVQQALQVYSLAKGYTRNSRSAALVAHVKAMQSALGRTGHPRRKKQGSDSHQPAAVVEPLDTPPKPPLPQSVADVRTEKAASSPSSTSAKSAKASAPRSRERSSRPSRPHPVDQPHDAPDRPPEDSG
jgi:hypothetical protein